MQTLVIAKDVVNTLTKTALLSNPVEFEEADILLVTYSSGVTATASQDATVDAYNATDWADVTKPAAAHHIMFGYTGTAKQFKAKDACAAGGLLILIVRERGERIKTS